MASVARIIPANQTARYEALLRAGQSIATCNDCENAGNELSRQLREIISFDYLHVVAFSAESDAVEWQLLEANGTRMDERVADEDSPSAWVHQHQELHVANEWSREARFSRHRRFLSEQGIASTCTLPM